MSKYPKKLPKEKFALVSKITYVGKKNYTCLSTKLYISRQKNYTFLPAIY